MESNQFINIDKFQILNSIGKGELGEVYKVKEISNEKIYAAKILNIEINPDSTENQEYLQFISKISSILSLNHPTFMQLIGISTSNFDQSPCPTIITEYAHNGSLYNIISSNSLKYLDNTRKLINIYGIATSLQYLHSHNIIHQDLKLENILLDDYLFPKIVDFGLIQIINRFVSESSNKRSPIIHTTKPEYLAPEILNDEQYSMASDVYAFSIIVYEILTGKTVFSDLNFEQVKEKVLVQKERPELSDEILLPYQNLIKKCWSQEPEERPNFDSILNELKNNKDFIVNSINSDEYHDYIDYIDNFNNSTSNNKCIQFDEYLNSIGKTSTITKVTIDNENHSSLFSSIKNFFGKFFSSDNNKPRIEKESFEISSQGCQLRGFILRPIIDRKLPTVIVSHGFGDSTRGTKKYAEIFVEEGYAAICFDFCMSGSGKSSGSSLGMSVLTEKVDLINVLDYVKTLDFVDTDRITLVGCSQGGFVSALAAVERENEIERLIMFYPALCIPDDARRGQMINAKFDPNNVPDRLRALFVKLSSKYVLDVINMDPFKEICSFKKPVLIVHGVKDKLVDISYSRRACEGYPNCKLVEVNGDHGFIFSGFAQGKQATIDYLHSFNS